MPKLRLSGIPTSALQAELRRRALMLGKLLKQREQLDKLIADLRKVAGETLTAETKTSPRKTKKAGRRRKSKKFTETAEQFILKFVKGKGAITSQINRAWKAMGRGGQADNTLGRLLKAGKVKREKLANQKGSRYTVA